MKEYIDRINPKNLNKCSKEDFNTAFLALNNQSESSTNISTKIKIIIKIILDLSSKLNLAITDEQLPSKLVKGLLLSNNFKHIGIGNQIAQILDINEKLVVECDTCVIKKMKNDLLKAKKLAYIDQITNKGNNLQFIEDINLIKSNKEIILVKILNFNSLNHKYTSSIGDQIINITLNKLINNLNKNSLFKKLGTFKAYRNSGVTFGFLRESSFLSELNKKEFKDTFKMIISNFHINIKELGKIQIEFKVGISCGIDANIGKSSKALYASSNSGDISLYSHEIDKKIKTKLLKETLWKEKIQEGLTNGNIISFYQGMRNNSNGKIEKYESLVRFEGEKRIHSPGEFLNIIEGTPLMHEVTKLMIKNTIKKMGTNTLKFSVNITEDDLNDNEFVGFINQLLVENHVSAERLTLEILEQISGNDIIFIKSIDKLKKIGLKIAIDDFGTGYSNFERLLKINADYLKIDGSFIQGINLDTKKWALVNSMVQFAHNMGSKVIAEYVDSYEIQQELEKMGIDYSQGYLFSKPSAKIEI